MGQDSLPGLEALNVCGPEVVKLREVAGEIPVVCMARFPS
jgi:hypothetical protein